MEYVLNERQLKILKCIINSDGFINGEVLSATLGISSKTLRSDIEMINPVLKEGSGAEIVSKVGIGYELQINNEHYYTIFKQIFNSKFRNNIQLMHISASRPKKIIRELLMRDEYYPSDYFTEEFFVSRTTLNKDLKLVKELLIEQHLLLENKSYYGMKISGKEIHKRLALVDFIELDEDSLDTNFMEYIPPVDFNKITAVLKKKVREYRISISNSSLGKIAKLINVSIYRYQKGFVLEEIDNKDLFIREMGEYALYEDILRELEIELPENEKVIHAIFIRSRRDILQNDNLEVRRYKEQYELSQKIYNWIFDVTGYSVIDVEESTLKLTRHLMAMMLRVNYGFEKRDVDINTIKENNNSYELSVLMAEFFKKSLDIIIQETEIAYASYCFAAYSHMFHSRKTKLAIVMDNGSVIGESMREQLLLRFEPQIELIEYRNEYDLKINEEEEYDCIITDLPRFYFDDSMTVVSVSHYPMESDFERLRNLLSNKAGLINDYMNSFHKDCFYRLDATHKDDAIQEMMRKLVDVVELPGDFTKMIYNREMYTSSMNENGVAVCSTLYIATVTPFVAIGIPNHFLDWNGQNCSLVIIVSNGITERIPYANLVITKRLFSNRNTVYDIITAKDFDSLIDIINKALYTLEIV